MRLSRCPRLTCARLLSLLVAAPASVLAAPAGPTGPAIAFYTGTAAADRPPVEALSLSAELVLPPARVNDAELAALTQKGVAVIARLGPSDLGAARAQAGAALLATLEKRGFAGLLFDGRDDRTSEAAETLLFEA